MGIDRRNFFRALGVASVSIALPKSFGDTPAGATPTETNPIEFDGILYDATLCIGCQSCEYACAERYDLPDPVGVPESGVVRKTTENSRIVVNAFNVSNEEKFMRTACNHCNNPACASACLTKAMLKTDEGPVIWREDKCMGCRSCMISCPFDIPKFEYNSPNPRIQKCSMCYDFVKEGGLPACVENCPTEALKFGKRRDLLEEANRRIYSEPDKYVHYIYGEHEAGGTGLLYIAGSPFKNLRLRDDIGTTSYPEYNKIFLYSVPVVLVLWPALLLGLSNSLAERKKDVLKEKEMQI